jgi:hypothetical protein
MEASKFSIVLLNGLLMLTRYPDDIELMEDMLKTSNELKEKTGLREPYLQLFAFPSKIYYNEELFIDPDFIREIKRTGKVLYSSL